MQIRIALLTWLVTQGAVFAQEPSRLLPFQGRLNDSSGAPLSGPNLVQFQIYGEPTSNKPLWTGEVHRVTVNDGLFNVMLGSSNSFPTNRADDPSRSFFDATLYLQITVDSNGDQQINNSDPPLHPRQALQPIIFTQEAGNARKLNGHDWSALFGANDPASGTVSGTRIAEGSLSATKLQSGSVGTAQLANGSVTVDKLGSRAVTAANLDPSVTNLFPVITPWGTNIVFSHNLATLGLARFDARSRRVGDTMEVQASFVFTETYTLGNNSDGGYITILLPPSAIIDTNKIPRDARLTCGSWMLRRAASGAAAYGPCWIGIAAAGDATITAHINRATTPIPAIVNNTFTWSQATNLVANDSVSLKFSYPVKGWHAHTLSAPP